MKKSVVLFFFLLVSAGTFAQSFNAGLRLGICGSQVNGDRLSGFDKAGLVGGGFVSRELSEHFALQFEIVYVQKGSRKPVDDNNEYYRMRVNYIEVPVLLLWHLSKNVDLTGGPSFGRLIFSEENDQLRVYEDAPPFKNFEFAGNFGVIYRMDEHWAVDARYSHSITTIRPFPEGYPTTYFDKGQYNVVIEFSLEYGF